MIIYFASYVIVSVDTEARHVRVHNVVSLAHAPKRLELAVGQAVFHQESPLGNTGATKRTRLNNAP